MDGSPLFGIRISASRKIAGVPPLVKRPYSLTQNLTMEPIVPSPAILTEAIRPGARRVGDRYELAAELAARYRSGSRRDRTAMLDAFCLATGYHRKYAIAVLRGRRRVAVRRRVARTRHYGPDFQRALLVAWEASGYVCSERLQPFPSRAGPALGAAPASQRR